MVSGGFLTVGIGAGAAVGAEKGPGPRLAGYAATEEA